MSSLSICADLEMVESEEVKQMATRAKMLKEILLEEVRVFYAAWKDKLEGLTKRHKIEQKMVMARGGNFFK